MNTPTIRSLRRRLQQKPSRMGLLGMSLVMAAVLTACGGDTAQNVLTAQFIDDPVSGLKYSCTNETQAPSSGFTNDQGQFSYVPGQTCTFMVGQITLGTVSSIPADGKVTPQDVAGVTRSATAAPAALAIARVLHSFNDGSAPGKIVIPAATNTRLESATPMTVVSRSGVISEAQMESLVAQVPGATLASAATARDALQAQIDQNLVSTSTGLVSASAPVVLTNIVLSSATPSNAAGLTEQLTATGHYSDGSHADLTSTVTWSSADTQKLTVNAAGLATGLRTGTATVSASLQPAGASSAVSGSFVQTTTAAVLQSIAVTHTASPVAGRTDQLTATGTYSDGTTADLTALATWATADDTKVSLSNSTAGLATGVAEGSASVTASYTPAGGTAITSPAFTETVLAPTVTNLVISYVQSGLSSLQKGASTVLQAVATWTNNTTQTVSSLVDWAVNAVSGAATVVVDALSNAATLTATAVGDVTVSARYQGVDAAGSLSLSVTPVISGTVSQGAPLDSGTVTILDSQGRVVASNVPINADGTYEAPPFDAASFTPPFIITATGQVFDGTATHVAMVNQGGTANVTPLSTLMAAGLTGGNVYKLTDAAVVQSLSSSLTTTGVNAKATELQTLVGSFASALGFTGNPVTSSYSNALDKVLDNLAIDVKPSGAATVLPQSAQRGDDESNAAPTRPTAASGLSSAALTAPSANSRSFSVKDAEMTAFMTKLNACLAADQASRSASACAGIALAAGEDVGNSASVYLNDGKDALTDFAALFSAGAESGWEPGASVGTPQILRQIDDTKLDVKFPIIGTTASGKQRNTIVSTLKLVNTASGQQFRLFGNQRKFGVSVTASALKVMKTQSNGDPVVTYEPSLNIRIGPIAYTENNVTTTLGAARICGPGLPGYVSDANPCGANGGVWMADAGLPVYAGSNSYSNSKRCGSGLTMVPFRVFSSASNDSANVLFSPQAGAQTFSDSTTTNGVTTPNYAPSSGLNCLSNFRLAQVDAAGAASVNTTGKGQSAAAYLRNYSGNTSAIQDLQAGDAYRVYLYGSSATSGLSAGRQQTAILTPNGQGYYTVRLRSRPLSIAEITTAPFAVIDPALVASFQSFKTNGPTLSSGKLPVSWTYQPGATKVNFVNLQYNNGGDQCGTRFSPLAPPPAFPASYVRACTDFSTAAVWSSGSNNISLQGTDAFGMLYITRLQ